MGLLFRVTVGVVGVTVRVIWVRVRVEGLEFAVIWLGY